MSNNLCQYCGEDDGGVRAFDNGVTIIDGKEYLYLHDWCLHRLEELSLEKKKNIEDINDFVEL